LTRAGEVEKELAEAAMAEAAIATEAGVAAAAEVETARLGSERARAVSTVAGRLQAAAKGIAAVATEAQQTDHSRQG
jgi:hypothetical protein